MRLPIGFVKYIDYYSKFDIQDDGYVGFIALIDRKASLNISDDYLERCKNPYYFLSCMVRKKVGLVDIFFKEDKELSYYVNIWISVIKKFKKIFYFFCCF